MKLLAVVVLIVLVSYAYSYRSNNALDSHSKLPDHRKGVAKLIKSLKTGEFDRMLDNFEITQKYHGSKTL
ncbi:hypothetical protein GE061_011388 [Apolygus lucorum]|uniref:Uncharacterized protein n=1 Tax=Apolygus lucorum TaxID=248454 RepID=A0A8S9Y009_APOLU|nr:hypothetical protein GE061_011388 [Apolygus lucorum]